MYSMYEAWRPVIPGRVEEKGKERLREKETPSSTCIFLTFFFIVHVLCLHV